MKKAIVGATLLATALLGASCSSPAGQEELFVKHVEFPPGATVEQKADMAARLVPAPWQYEWQQLELTAFLHFGINTFTDREWGDGKEDPSLFNPTELDADQWVRVLKEAGFKMVILTAKHHDGFCLWPTATTSHSVASSPWRGGCGDVVGELQKACERHGMKFGVYLSPWDRNAESYGDSPRYNEFFLRQLTELLTNYGRVDEVWFDGANGEGPNGKKQEYDWDSYLKTIRELQPQTVTAIMGDDVRWVGNERGLGRETEWSATVLAPGSYSRSATSNNALGITNMSKDLGSRAMLERATEAFWYPSEVDVSIRPGWFYHSDQDCKVKSLRQLADIYYESVGRNSVLLLNIPPDRRGLIHEADAKRLKEFADFRAKTFADNKVGSKATAWTARAGETREFALKGAGEINTVLLQEDITKGQRVEKFTVEAQTADGWRTVAQGTTIGHKRLMLFQKVKAGKLRVKIDSCRLTANISAVGAYLAPPTEEAQGEAEWNNMPRSEWKSVSAQPLTIDLGRSVTLRNFTYAPAGEEARPTTAFKFRLSTSGDGEKWSETASGEFSNIVNNPIPQTIRIRETPAVRFVKIEGTTVDGAPATIAAEELGLWIAE